MFLLLAAPNVLTHDVEFPGLLWQGFLAPPQNAWPAWGGRQGER